MAVSGVNYVVYDDDPSLGEAAPAIDSVEVIQGEQQGFVAGKINVVFFWAKWDKASYAFYQYMHQQCVEKHGDAVFFHAISCDPQKDYAEGFITKEKYADYGKWLVAMAETGNAAISWDTDKAVFNEYKAFIQVLAMNIPHMFIVNGDGIVLWHEILRVGVADCQFFNQLDRVVAGEDVELKNGPTPIIEDDDDSSSDAGGAEIDDDFELF